MHNHSPGHGPLYGMISDYILYVAYIRNERAGKGTAREWQREGKFGVTSPQIPARDQDVFIVRLTVMQ